MQSEQARLGVWVCSAWEPEQRLLRSLWQENLCDTLEPIELETREQCLKICLPSQMAVPEFLLLGVGAFQALEALTSAFISRPHPRHVFFVATAGASHNAVNSIGDVVNPTRVYWEDFGVAKGFSYLPDVMQKEQTYLIGSGIFAEQTDQVVGQSSLGITRKLDGGVGVPFVENLELYSCARACSKYAIPLFAYLGVSNWIGEKAHDEWRQFGLAASCSAQLKLYAALGGGSSSK